MPVDTKAYQTVIAGRVREDEQIAFFGQNKVALPTRVTNFNALGGSKFEALTEDFLASDSVGKPGTRTPTLNNHVFNPNQIS